MNINWLVNNIGKPWAPHSYGPESFDCWGWVWYALTSQAGLQVPKFQFVNPHNKRDVLKTFNVGKDKETWINVAKPKNYTVVLMGRGKYPNHCGLYLKNEGGVIVHCGETAGVCAVSVVNLYEQCQMKIFGYYNHKDLV